MAAGVRGLAGRWIGGVCGPRTAAGSATANVTAYYYRKATPRTSMPIAYVVAVYRYMSGATPNSGQYPNSQPPFGQ